MSKGKRRVSSREFKLSAVKRALAGGSVAALSPFAAFPSLFQWLFLYFVQIGAL